MLLQPTDKCAGNVSEFLQKDYKLLHFRFRRFGVCLVFFEKFFQEYIKENSPSVKDKTETTENEAQASATVQSRNAPESEEKASETKKSFDITATPSDILAAMAEFESKHKSEKGDGKIVETKYGKANATNTYKNICVKNTTQTKSINIPG